MNCGGGQQIEGSGARLKKKASARGGQQIEGCGEVSQLQPGSPRNLCRPSIFFCYKNLRKRALGLNTLVVLPYCPVSVCTWFTNL